MPQRHGPMLPSESLAAAQWAPGQARGDDGICSIMAAKHILVGALVTAAALLGGLWLFLRHEPAAENLSAFQQACIEGQRRAVTGQTLPLDDGSEAKALAYCTCVAAEVEKQLSAQELADLGLGQPSAAAGAKLDQVVAYCRDRTR